MSVSVSEKYSFLGDSMYAKRYRERESDVELVGGIYVRIRLDLALLR